MSAIEVEALIAEHGLSRDCVTALPDGHWRFEVPVLSDNHALLELAYGVLSYQWLQWVEIHPVSLVLSQGKIGVEFRADPNDVDLIQYLFNEVKGARTLFL